MEATPAPVTRQVGREDAAPIHEGIFLSHETKRILPFMTTWTDLEGVMLSGISQTEKGKYHEISFTCGIYRTERTNETEKDS